ncbi:MAG TPA: dephospho-CoA kinase [Balneolaceae bacterium]|nr:dephospho-CoA kinase [Balneolaceae bacterium]
MLKIGVTGGIGSGKTTVCNTWERLGAFIINADDLAKILMANNASVKKQLVDAFGSKTYHSDGSLNRAFLAAEAFENNKVEKLNAIVHPAVFKATDQLLEEAEQNGYKVSVYEAALLFEYGRPEIFDFIVLVLADETNRITRVRERDNVGEIEVKSRIKKQQNFVKFENKADIVIRNNDSLKTLEEQAEKVYQRLLKRST